MKKQTNFIKIIFFLFPLLALLACSSAETDKNMPAEDRFALGMKEFNDEDYLTAKNNFEIVKLQFPGSSVADDAQFYLGECYFKREEYLLASEEYKAMKRSMQTSPFLPQAQYKIAMCYYMLAPESHLDQQYTLKAIDAFQTFIEYYPTDELVADASAKITELNLRLAQKDFDTGELYMKLEYYRAASYYYNSVVEKFHDTPLAEPAHLGLMKALVARKKYDDAKREVDKFFERYPHSKLRDDVESIKSEVESKLKSQSSNFSGNQKDITSK